MSTDLVVFPCVVRDTPFTIRCAPEISGVVGPLISALEHPDGHPGGVTFTVRRQGDASSPWHVGRDDVLLMGCGRLTEALHGLMVYVTQHVVGGRTDLLSIHAAGVVVDRAGILLPASSGCGKTTLCARLLQRGAAYLSDDSVAVTPEGRMLGYAKPLGFKAGTWERFTATSGVADLADLAVDPRQTVWHVPPSRLCASTASDSDLALAARPRYVAGAPLAIEDMARHEMARELLTQVQNLAVFGRVPALEVIGAMVAGVRCLSLTYGDAADAAAALVELAPLGERAEPVPYHFSRGAPPGRPHPAPAPDAGGLCFDDGGVLVRGATGELLTLDPVGARIWPLLDGSRSVAAVAGELAATFDAPVAQIRADVAGWVDDLVDHAFLVRPP